nr:rhodanese-like domain-containing protein [Allomuricauda sp.]
MQKVLNLLFSAVCCLFFCSCQSQKEEGVKKIDKATVKSDVIGKDVQFIDVRTPKEYLNGHIDDAVNMNVNDPGFKDQILQLDKEQPVYLYCKMGGRSNRAAQLLQEMGFQTIYDYSGGYKDWVKPEK